eukprot:5036791-Prymnesium_polylepis.2
MFPLTSKKDVRESESTGGANPVVPEPQLVQHGGVRDGPCEHPARLHVELVRIEVKACHRVASPVRHACAKLLHAVIVAAIVGAVALPQLERDD